VVDKIALWGYNYDIHTKERIMKITVTTILTQEITAPEGTSKEEILDFLAEHESFRGAFQGVTDGVFTIEDLGVVEETVDLGDI